MKNIFKVTSLILVFILMFSMIGCGDEHEHNFVNGSCACGEKHNCSYGEWVVVKDATETEEGSKERVCSCGAKETEVIEKLAHTHVFGEWVVVKVATEAEEGSKERVCSCGEKETEVIEKLAHTHVFGEWVVIKEATESEEGLKERTCSCGEKETESIEKLEHVHNYVNGKCKCGEIKTLETVADFDEFLVNTRYSKSEYVKEIKYNGILLYKENTSSQLKGETYYVASETQELIEDGSYLADSFIVDENAEAVVISLELLEDYFEEFTITEKTLEGKIKDSQAEAFIKVASKDVNVKVVINDNFRASSIIITYVDCESNFNVSLSISYTY